MAKAKVGKNFIKKGIDLPKCPVCMEVMTPPIFQCESGHSICHVCKLKLYPPKCPLCRQGMTEMRNWQLEEIVEKAEKPCPNKGCKYTIMSSKLQDHIKECIFRDMDCPHGIVFGRCSWSGKIHSMLDHFKDKHPENCFISLDTEVDIGNISTEADNRLMYLLTLGKYLFIFTIKVDTHQKMVYYVVQFIGNKSNAQQYVYEINISSKQDNRRKAIFNDHCFSDGFDINELFRMGKCGMMPINMFAHFIQKKMISLKVTITRTHANASKPNTTNCNQNQRSRGKSPGPLMQPKGTESKYKKNFEK